MKCCRKPSPARRAVCKMKDTTGTTANNGSPQPMDVRAATLEGPWVRLEPLATGHAEDLLQAAGDPEIWRYFPVALQTLDAIQAWISTAQELQRSGDALPFATVDLATGRAIGS